MNPWVCLLLISMAGALGGLVNAFLSDNGFLLPKRVGGGWCPGFVSNVLIGASSAVVSWSLYGSGAAVDLAVTAGERQPISLTASAMAGAFLVGVAGAKWLTNEADKRMLKETVNIAARTVAMPEPAAERMLHGSPRQIREAMEAPAPSGT